MDARIAAALARADLGDCGPLEDGLRAGDLAEDARLALRAALAGLDPEAASAPTPEEIAEAPAGPYRGRAALDMQGLAFARFDAEAAARYARGVGADGLATGLAALRLEVLAGRAEPARAEALAAEARAASEAAIAIEATALLALAHLTAGDTQDGLRHARIASRMARTEGRVRGEYVANLTLARARRYTGAPHAAARILAALDLVIPRPWRPWLAWEWLLLGRVVPALRAAGDTGPAVEVLAALDDGADPSDAARLGSAPGLTAEARVLWSAARPDAPAAHPWIAGETDRPPVELLGAVLDLDPARARPANVVAVRAEDRGRRVLLVDGRAASDALLAAVGPAERTREHALLTALVLGPPEGLSVEAAHRRVFGVDYEAEIHDGALRTLLYRTRRLLPGRAGIDRTPTGLRLRGDAVAWDPKAAPGAEQRVLALLARGERLGAKAIAEALGAPLRSVQATLQALVEDERCASERAGRQVRYFLEDTTFYEPTLSRLHPTGRPVT